MSMSDLEKVKSERNMWRKWCQAAESREADCAKREEELDCENLELREKVAVLEGALTWAHSRIRISTNNNSEWEREQNWKEYKKYEHVFLALSPKQEEKLKE